MAGDQIRDRLSELPDGILHRILSVLPTDEMVRTSILSSRWRRLWTNSPVLHFTRSFSNESIPLEDYASIVDHCLHLCAASEKVRSVRFPLSDSPEFSSALDRWIRFAADRSIEELILNIIYLRHCRIEMPPSLFDCLSLSTLKLESVSISAIPSGFQGFRSLETLVFYHVQIADESLAVLLWACPRIKTLSLSSCKELKRLVIRSSTMRSLTVYECNGLDRMEIICAPELRRLMYHGDLLKVGSLEGLPNLEEVAVLSSARHAFEDRQLWRQFISAIAHVKILSVNCWFFEFMLGEDPYVLVFENLKEFHWWPVFKRFEGAFWSAERFTSASLRALVSTLRGFPYLEQLCVHRTYYYLELEDESDALENRVMNAYLMGLDFSEVFDVEDHNQDHERDDPLQEFEGVGYGLPELKTIKMIDFSGKEEELRLVKFLVDKAIALESVFLFYVPEIDEELDMIRKKTSPFHKASPLACLSFLELSDEDPCPKHDRMWYQFMTF